MKTFQSRRDVENEFADSLGDGWPENANVLVARAVIDRAHAMGLRYGQDWSNAIADILGDDSEPDEWINRVATIFKLDGELLNGVATFHY
jgi:hypothetical protein